MPWKESLLDAVDRQHWLERYSEATQNASHMVLQSGGSAGRAVRDALHGTWLGHPLHPVLTDVPIGAWTAALVLDCIDRGSGDERFGAAADAAITVGLVGAAGAAITGINDWQHTRGHARQVGSLHALLNSGATVLYLGSLGCRRRDRRGLGFVLSLAGYASSAVAAWFGGHLVYHERVGVDHSPVLTGPEEFTPVLNEADLPEGQMTSVAVEGTRVLLARLRGQVHAMADACSHLGGPLSDGKLHDDGVVACPWHDSHFRLEDGSVQHGPATFRQPCYEVRVRDGSIEVRAPQAAPRS